VYVAVFRAGPGDGPALARHGIDDADPRHIEIAGLDRHPARLVEQAVALARAQHRRVDAAQHGVDAAQVGDLLRLLVAPGDVPRDAVDADDGAARVTDRRAAAVDPAHGAAGNEDAVFAVERAAARGLVPLRRRAAAVVRVHEVPPQGAVLVEV